MIAVCVAVLVAAAAPDTRPVAHALPTVCQSPAGARLTPAAAAVTLVRPTGAVIVLDVERVDNPSGAPVTLIVETPGAAAPLATLTLYPPDRPARLAFRAPRDAETLVVRLAPAPANRGAPRSIDIRLLPR